MDDRYKTISITNVGPFGDRLCVKVERGVFNFDSFLNYLSQSVDNSVVELTIDLSRVGWIALFDWWAFTCILHGQIATHPQLRIRLDFVGDNINGLIPYHECADYFAGLISLPRFHDIDYCQSYAIHRVLNFVKSLEGPSGFENVARGQIVLAGLTGAEAARPGWYRKKLDVDKSIILPRTSVEAKEMCLKFASRSQIEIWREAMVAKRVPNAAIFQSEEFWRILCHELARNVVEHAKGPGFITGRVVLPIESQLPRWCHDVYDKNTLEQLESAKEHGFVELCVSDAGIGIPATIEKSYRNRYEERHVDKLLTNNISHSDLIKFAFDELGTCKDADHSWITDRHALGHMLFVTEKYGGILSVFSGSAALTYIAGNKTFERCVTQLGFNPQLSRDVSPAINGTHIHLIIPLTPQKINNSSNLPAFYCNIPSSFHIDYKHPVGPLIPVRDKLGALSKDIEGDEVFKFKEACRALVHELLQTKHPRNEMLVFDFSEVDWSPSQFETFLYLLQNVFINRIVLFTQITRDFAELINAQEDEEHPTYLANYVWEDIQKRELDREFTDGKFMETYSALGALVLALGPDQGEFLFGVRGSGLRNALLELIKGEKQTIQGLCLAHTLDEHVLTNILNRASQLFRCDDLQRWCSVFVCGDPDRDDLEIQRLRAITKHFDIVAKHCSAWRGKRNSQSNDELDHIKERFYLPTEDAIYTEFFETSRILARDRYVIEVAERLIYRTCIGLDTRPMQKLTLHDVDILACSTTPTVLLAEAIRRAWPVEPNGKRPVVIDYGPSLFSGADPAHIPISEEGSLKPRAIIVQDLFDEGTLSKKLVTLAEQQGIDVLFVLSFIRFIDSVDGIKYKSKPFPPNTDWNDNHPTVGKPVHSMIELTRPDKKSRMSINWGADHNIRDYIVDPRSLRPVPIQSLRLESGYREKRSLTSRDPYLKELDNDGGDCRLAAGHFVYGNRHFAVVADVRGILTGAIGYKIINWLADVCCNRKDRHVQWENNIQNSLDGEVTAILLPLHSQIHYILPGLQTELAQRGWRVPHFFLDATSFGGGVETYDIPYQLQDQIDKANMDIKAIMNGLGSPAAKLKKAKAKQLRLLFIDDAIFSGRTIQTVLDSLGGRPRTPSFKTSFLSENSPK
ncbi:MAG: hypothetical protein WAW31_15760 [Smithella sp.]